MGIMRPDLVMRNVIPVVMAGIVGLYGVIIDVFIYMSCNSPLPMIVGLNFW